MESIPLLNYDSSQRATVQFNPKEYGFTIPKLCIPVFFKDVVSELIKLPNVKKIGSVDWETGDCDYYSYQENGKELCFYHTWVGASISGAILDASISLGAKTIIACGGCGVLDKSICVNKLILPNSSLRDEGASYHYLPFDVECKSDERLLEKIKAYFDENKIPYITGKTWTTDGFYRETKSKVDYAVQKGCIAVEMEYSALCAVAQFRSVRFAQLLYAGDLVIPENHDKRSWQKQSGTRRLLFEIAKDILFSLE